MKDEYDMPTLERAVEHYKSVLKMQSLAILVMMVVVMLGCVWLISRQDVSPADIMQEVRIQGDTLSQRQIELKTALVQLETVNAERAATIEKVSTSLTAIEEKISDHDIRLERIERDYILRANNEEPAAENPNEDIPDL